MNILALKERTKNLLSLGESHFREFKSAYQGPLDNKKPGSIKDLNRYIAEALVAFSNADGGSIIIGVEDDGTVTGLPFTESEIQSMLSAYKDYIHTDSTGIQIISATLMDEWREVANC
ncbi:AlbA family DNA-binding domain-containing protein [Aeromonas caviae]